MRNDPCVLPDALVSRYQDASAVVKECEAEISRLILEHYGIAKGDILQDPDTGCQYKVLSAHGYRRSIGADMYDNRCYVQAVRYFKSGNRAGRTARSSTHLGEVTRYKKVNV